MIDLIPPKGRVIIEKHEPEKKTKNGIILRINDREPSFTGTVKSVSKYSTYSVGETILFQPRVSSTINFDGENLSIIWENDIISVL